MELVSSPEDLVFTVLALLWSSFFSVAQTCGSDDVARMSFRHMQMLACESDEVRDLTLHSGFRGDACDLTSSLVQLWGRNRLTVDELNLLLNQRGQVPDVSLESKIGRKAILLRQNLWTGLRKLLGPHGYVDLELDSDVLQLGTREVAGVKFQFHSFWEEGLYFWKTQHEFHMKGDLRWLAAGQLQVCFGGRCREFDQKGFVVADSQIPVPAEKNCLVQESENSH